MKEKGQLSLLRGLVFFNDFIHDANLIEVKSSGRRFTRMSSDGLKLVSWIDSLSLQISSLGGLIQMLKSCLSYTLTTTLCCLRPLQLTLDPRTLKFLIRCSWIQN